MSHQDTVDMLAEVMRPLAPWGENTKVEDICVNKPNEVFVLEGGKFSRHEIDLDYEACYDIAVLAAAVRRQTVGDHAPIVGADITFCGSLQRLQAMLPSTVQEGTVSLTIRRFEDTVAPVSAITSRYDISRWNQWQKRNEARAGDFAEALKVFDTGDLEAFLNIIIALRMNILFSGSMGGGKTTLFRSVLALSNESERIITIEDALELIVKNPNCVRLLHSKGGLAANGVEAKHLLDSCLRMRPDRIILQELRDGESAFLFAAEALVGTRGSMTTIHGGSAPEAFKRLFTLVKGSPLGSTYTKEVVLDLLAGAVDVIIPLENLSGRFAIREVFFNADAWRRGETVAKLMGE